MKTLGALIDELTCVHVALWHEEDRARANDYADARKSKIVIDKLNQRRNDIVELIDAAVIEAAQQGLTFIQGIGSS